ncbi:hypothetical protein [Vibrio aerogenes]|uniref:hypothetical protein n=1 Tax=Vibrio aerogenes TaxID=92172 RepID=UPI0021C42700|nr:hypothetical protein [Vibrio aerogenes]
MSYSQSSPATCIEISQHQIQLLEDKFWSSVAEMFPQITTGDLDPFVTAQFSVAIQTVVNEWLYANSPEQH